MFYVDYCLCGIPLKRGSKIIGLILMAVSALKIIAFSASASLILSLSPEVLADDTFHNGVRGMLIALVVISFVEFIVAACLVYGTQKSRASFIHAWIASNKMLIVLSGICYIAIALIYFIAQMPGAGIGVLAFGSCNAVTTFFFFVIVNSHYRDLGFNHFP